jgi:hypothetical protein
MYVKLYSYIAFDRRCEMNKTRTIFTAVAEEILHPTPYIACPKCGIEYPKWMVSGTRGLCLPCRIEIQYPVEASMTHWEIPPAPEELKCQVCGRNFKNHPHNFDLRYKHPSGSHPCCKYCQAIRMKAEYKVDMDFFKQEQAHLKAIEDALHNGDVKTAERLQNEHIERKRKFRLMDEQESIERMDKMWREKFASLGLKKDRHGNKIDNTGNVILKEGQTEPYSIHNPNPNEEEEKLNDNS